MKTFDIDFSDEALRKLSRSVGNRMKTQLAKKLEDAGLAERVKLTFTENGYGVPIDFHLEGSPDDVVRAKEALGVPEDAAQ